MSRLFDAGTRKRDLDEIRNDRNGVLRRAEEVDRLVKENIELSETSQKLGDQLAEAQTVHTVVYESYRAHGSKWNIEHAQVGPDYVYQIFPLRPPKLHWKDVVTHFISAMDSVFPRSVSIKYAPPSERFQLKYYTIRVEGITTLPGWESAALVRCLKSLSGVDVWTD